MTRGEAEHMTMYDVERSDTYDNRKAIRPTSQWAQRSLEFVEGRADVLTCDVVTW